MKRLVLSVALSIILVMTGLTCAFAQDEITLSLWSFTDELTRPIERFEQMYPNIKIGMIFPKLPITLMFLNWLTIR